MYNGTRCPLAPGKSDNRSRYRRSAFSDSVSLFDSQANGRLGPTGALIAGNAPALIAGQNLDNVGTLKAGNKARYVARVMACSFRASA